MAGTSPGVTSNVMCACADFCLNMSRLGQLCDFATATGAGLVFGLNAVWGRADHNLSNPLDFTNIEALLACVCVKSPRVRA